SNVYGQQNLWGFGISGDVPLVLLRVVDAGSVPLARQLLNAQEYWRVKGLRADIAILNEHPADYLNEMQKPLDHAGVGGAVGKLVQPTRGRVPPAQRRYVRVGLPTPCRRRSHGAGWGSW